MSMMKKSLPVPCEIKIDFDKREVTGYANVFDVRDNGGDVSRKGDFASTLSRELPKNRIKVMREHEVLIGRPVHAEEDGRGLLTVSKISRTSEGNDAITLIGDGVLDAMSIGYTSPSARFGTFDGKPTRFLGPTKLYEWSFVAHPMNEESLVLGVKEMSDGVLESLSAFVDSLTSPDLTPEQVEVAAHTVGVLDRACLKLISRAADRDVKGLELQALEDLMWRLPSSVELLTNGDELRESAKHTIMAAAVEFRRAADSFAALLEPAAEAASPELPTDEGHMDEAMDDLKAMLSDFNDYLSQRKTEAA